MNITELSVKRPTLIVVIFTTLTFLGFVSLSRLNYELLPKFTTPIITVSAIYPGASPSETETNVTKKLEEVLSTLPNFDVIRSVSTQGVSLVIVTLKQGANVESSVNDAIRKVQSVRGSLPADCLEPAVNPVSIDEMPVMVLGLKSSMSDTDLYDFYKFEIEPRFQKIDGVATINLIGDITKEIRVNVNSSALERAGLSILQVVDAVRMAGFELPAGSVTNSQREVNLRVAGKITDISQIGDIMVSGIRVRDLAEIIETSSEPTSIYRINGIQSLGIQITKKQDANTVLVCSGIKQEAKAAEERFSQKGIEFSVQQDSSLLVKDAADGVGKDLILAILLVTLIMILFLNSRRNAVIVMITVPLSLIATIIGIRMFGYTLNLMTLLGLSLIIGTLVDDAIVVLENVYRHIEMGKERVKATLEGVKEVIMTVISTSMVLIVVFLPVALSNSIITPVIEPFAMVIVISVVVSTFAALTLVPLMTSKFAAQSSADKRIRWFESLIGSFANRVVAILSWSIRHIALTLFITIALFSSALYLLAGGYIGAEFLSMGDIGEGIVNLEYPKDYTLRQNNLKTAKIEEFIASRPEVKALYTSVGVSGSILASEKNGFQTEIKVLLWPKSERKVSSSKFFKDLENEINSSFAGVKARSGIVPLMGSADENPIQIVFRGTDKDSLLSFAQRMAKLIEKVPGTSNVKLTAEGGAPEIIIRPDEFKMSLHNVSRELLAATVRASFLGDGESRLTRGEFDYKILIKLDEFNRRSIEDVANLTIINRLGVPVKLEQVASISEEFGYSRLERYGRVSSVILESQAIGRAVGDVGTDVLNLLSSTPMPEGIEYLPESDLKYQSDAFGSLGIALIMAIVLVYLIMVALYQSYSDPLVVMFSIPLSIVGALYALALANQTLSIFSILGIIMLIGLVTKNAILVIDFANSLYRPAQRVNNILLIRALFKAVKLRIRPILMTAASTVIGMLPIALSTAPGSEWKNGMGWALIGGITCSMLLSLVIVPLVKFIFEQIKSRIKTTLEHL